MYASNGSGTRRSRLDNQRMAKVPRLSMIKGHKGKIWDYYEQEVLHGLNSGQSVPLTPAFWDEIRAEVKERLRTEQAEKTA
jgi:hypothetical protein